ncbi:MAG: hypothetical protein EBU90_30160, partial [Proteobacteria bacterium]|nr:hypothetical protein [Pseudomonadota bacterium]
KNSISNITNAAIQTKSLDGTFNAVQQNFNLSLKKRTSKVKATIALYMPDTVNFTNSASYGNLSLRDVAMELANASKSIPIVGGVVGGVAGAATSIAQADTTKLFLATQGLAINPQEQLLFDGIDFRTYQMAFTFTPYSKDEADTVKKIIQLFRSHAAPRLVPGGVGSGMFFIPPSTFNLDFLFNGKPNQNISKVAESVIESIDVNYSPNGWAAHTDGAPVQTTLTIGFKEIELIDRIKIEKDGF